MDEIEKKEIKTWYTSSTIYAGEENNDEGVIIESRSLDQMIETV